MTTTMTIIPATKPRPSPRRTPTLLLSNLRRDQVVYIPQPPSKSNLSILFHTSSQHATTLRTRVGLYHKTASTLDHTTFLSRVKLHLQAVPHRIPTKSISRHAQAIIDSERRITFSLFVSTDNHAARRRPSQVALSKLPGIDENDVYPPLPPVPVVAHPMVRTKARRPRPRFRDIENNTPTSYTSPSLSVTKTQTVGGVSCAIRHGEVFASLHRNQPPHNSVGSADEAEINMVLLYPSVLDV
ncbi:hypothetical protein C8Q74DRAFT_1257429 [Fomes fomentarius]|nr:hypothetical protein C8Q74DRAFT_1257429 [Fomes fomentarius]